jgi:hypothetical protein
MTLRLRCPGCGRSVYGDIGRHRHPSPTCEAFRAAVPLIRRQRSPGHDARIKGHSYPQAWLANARSKAGAETTAQLVWILAPRLPEPEGGDPAEEQASALGGSDRA